MKTLGIGIDIINNKRIRALINNKSFIDRTFGKSEIKLSKKRFMPFPPDEVLILNNSENIKRKMKNIIYKSFK